MDKRPEELSDSRYESNDSELHGRLICQYVLNTKLSLTTQEASKKHITIAQETAFDYHLPCSDTHRIPQQPFPVPEEEEAPGWMALLHQTPLVCLGKWQIKLKFGSQVASGHQCQSPGGCQRLLHILRWSSS